MPTNDLLPRDLSWHPPALSPGYHSSVLRSPRHSLLSLGDAPADLSGPVFGPEVVGALDHDLTRNYAAVHGAQEEALGPRIAVHGRLLDENGRPLPGALIEIWQANAGGRYRHIKDGYRAPLDPNFGGCGRCLTDAKGRYRFMTIQPGAYPFPNGPNAWRPAHIHFSVFGEAFAQRLITQMYFEGDPTIPNCPIVQTIADPKAVDALVARLDLDAAVSMDHLAYRFDIVLRGRRATVFENRMEGM